MTEWKLFPADDEIARVSTFEFHEHRERVPHLEQGVHRPRLEKVAERVVNICYLLEQRRITPWVSDLGCGDGGLLQLLRERAPHVLSYGYDFQPSNQAGWAERDVAGTYLDVFGGVTERVINAEVMLGDVVVMTEVLEHLSRPHAVLQHIACADRVKYVVASSPHTETAESHDECHAWAWDCDGYRDLFTNAGFVVVRQDTVGMFQIIVAASDHASTAA